MKNKKLNDQQNVSALIRSLKTKVKYNLSMLTSKAPLNNFSSNLLIENMFNF